MEGNLAPVTSAIKVRGLVKSYGETTAVAGIDLTVDPGQVFALLGPNGAGKTTTVEILEGHRTADRGSVAVLGMDPRSDGRRFRDRIGIVLQTTAIEPELTVTEALDIYGSTYSRRRPAGELIDLVGLEEKAKARIKTLSGGQQRRLELALGLVGDPDLLFLDEPTTGFDPSARRQAWSTIENLASLGKTILLTTHYMDESQHLADRIAIIVHGKIVAEGTPGELVRRYERDAVIRFSLPAHMPPADLPVVPSRLDDGAIEFHTATPTQVLGRLTQWAVERGIELDHLAVQRSSLEDVYLELTRGHHG